MEYMFMPLKRYADFSGRSGRKEYWMFVLFQILLFGSLTYVFFASGIVNAALVESFVVIAVLIMLGFFIPNLAVQVRRLHDQDMSGWFVLLGFVPYVGGIIMLVLMCKRGTAGPNRYGDDLTASTAAVFE